MLVSPVAAIVNPHAGSGHAAARWQRVARVLAGYGVELQTVVTEAIGHATALASEVAAGGARTVVAVGGDGTVHEVINGLRPFPEVLFTTLAAGTGTDFARNAGLPRRPHRFTAELLYGPERWVDLGQTDGPAGRVFVNFAEVGLGAAVVSREVRYSNHWPGRLAYFLASIEAGLREPARWGRIWVDGAVVYEGDLISAVVANGRYFGGGMKIAPQASMNDGLLDVILLTDFSRSELVTHIWKIYPGLHLRHHKVLWLRASRVTIEPENALHLDLDGELYTGAAGTISVVPRGLRLAC